MRPAQRLSTFLVVAILGAAPVTAGSFQIFKKSNGSTPVCPQVEFDADVGSFLVLGRERRAVKTRQVGANDAAHGPWMPEPIGHGEWYSPWLVFSPEARSYLLTGQGKRFVLLDQGGNLVSEHRFPSIFGSLTLAASTLSGGGWLAVVADCKYGCSYLGWIVGPEGELRRFVDLNQLPSDDQYIHLDRMQAGVETAKGIYFVVWEDGYGETVEGPSHAVLGQRLRPNGKLFGERLEIARHGGNASQPHMVYNESRQEWLIVYRQGRRVKGRFLHRTKLSRPMRISDRGQAGDAPSIAWSPQRGVYLVTWTGADGAGGLYGRFLREDGDALGDSFKILGPQRRALVWRPGYAACGDVNCLVAWIDRSHGAARAVLVPLPPPQP